MSCTSKYSALKNRPEFKGAMSCFTHAYKVHHVLHCASSLAALLRERLFSDFLNLIRSLLVAAEVQLRLQWYDATA